MKKKSSAVRDPDMLPEYDFSGGVRGYYAKRIKPGSKLVLVTEPQAKARLAEIPGTYRSAKPRNRSK